MTIYKSLEEAIGIFGGTTSFVDRTNYGRGGPKQLANFDPDPDLEPELREQEKNESLEEMLFGKNTSS